MNRSLFLLVCVLGVVYGCMGPSADDLFKQGEEATHHVDQFPVAEAKLAEFLDRFPTDPRADIALQALARVLMNQDKGDAAIARYERLIQQFPDSRYCPQAQFMIGYIYDQAGKVDQARLAYQKVIESYPQSDLADDAQISIQNMGKAPELWLFPADGDSSRKS